MDVNRLEITVRGQAKPTPRIEGQIIFPRGGAREPFIHFYTPKSADEWKGKIRKAFAPYWPVIPWGQPITLDIIVWLPRLEGQYGSNSPRGAFPCVAASMGDWDNIGKAISDALNPISEEKDRKTGLVKKSAKPGLWIDDRLVFDARVRKFHHALGAAPGMRIIVEQAAIPQLSLLECYA